jgi:iron-sulfur cluster insertion protein
MERHMENTTTTIQDINPLIFTDSAAEKVKKLIEEEKNPALNLRVFITGGGCSGFQYGFTFDEKVQDGDAEIANCGVKLLVDPMSIQYLRGAEIDYQEGLEGAQFVIKNPNAKTTCGCGSSFST